MATVRVHQPLVVDELIVREYTPDDLPQLAQWVEVDPARGLQDALGIFSDGRLIGGTGLHDRNGPDDVEIGYWLDAEWQGRGIATRVTRALTDYAFRHPEVQRVLIKHRPDNLRSQRIPERLGFRRIDHQGTCTCGDGDHVTWAVTRSEWLPCDGD